MKAYLETGVDKRGENEWHREIDCEMKTVS